MVARVRITTTVEDDGSVRLMESQIQEAGLQAGYRILVEIVKDARPVGTVESSEAVEAEPVGVLSAEELADLPFDEWLAYGRSMYSFDGLTVEEIRRQAEEAIADEWWERNHRHE